MGKFCVFNVFVLSDIFILVRNSIINRQFRYSYNNGALVLILINIAVYIVTNFFPQTTYYLAMIPSLVFHKHWYWQFATYMFVHGSFSHLFSNMLGILIFSVALERKIGTKEYILYYFLCGIFAGAASYLSYLYSGTNAILLGASGALYSVMLLFAVFFPTAVILIFGILPVRAPILVLFYFLIEFFSQSSADGVAHTTHLYGLIFGWLYLRIRMRIKPLKVWGII